MARRTLKFVLAFIGISAVASVSLAAWLTSTDSGKDWVKKRIEGVVTDNIPGRLTIGRIVDLGPPLIAEDVRFYHYDGRLVLACDHAEVEADLGEAIRGRLGFKRAAVDGGRIVLSPDPDGRVAFEAAVDKPVPPGQPHDPHGGLHYNLQSMHVQNFRVEAKFSDLADFKVDKVQGFVGVRRIETSGTVVELEKISGRVSPEFLGKRTEIKQLDGWIHGKLKHVAQMHASMGVGDGELKLKLNVYDREKQPISIEIERAKGAGDLVATAANFADGLLGDSLEVVKKD
jgi:hypothetical protein